jgi:hypothetical protein
MVQLGKERGVAKIVVVAITDSLKLYNLNLVGPSNQCLPSPLHTGS